VLFPFLVLAFFEFSLLRTHFWPFTEVLRKIWPGVTQKVGKTEGDTNVTDGFLDWRPTQTPTIGWPIGRAPVRQPPELPTRFLSVLSVQSVVNFILAQGSRLLFLAKLLESGFAAQRVPNRIESKEGRCNGR
jgi:hypothetical protein